MSTTDRRRVSHGVAPFETKDADTKTRTFAGLASTWERDLGGDIIHKGAYARTLDHWRQGGAKRVIPLGDSHPKPTDSIRRVLGKLVEAQETDDGLLTRFQVVKSADGDELLARVEGGFITGLSIGYEAVPSATERKDGTRHLREVKLWEISTVIWGMNESALIDPSSVKSLLAAARDGTLTDEEKAELRALLTDAPAPEPAAAAGLAPDDPARLAAEEVLRDVTLRSLASRA